MHYYKYGIVVHRILICEISKWRIAFFDGAVSDHQLLDVPDRIFDFDPCPGDSVKAKFDEQCDDTPSTITRCIDEWIRDVEIIDSHVVIFAIVHLSENCLNTAVAGEFPNEFFYIIQNENTDFCRIAIPKSAVDKAISERSPLQKPDELLIYRIGVSWDPFLFEGNINVNWRYHKNIPIVPVFELYYRENTLPYLSDSMIYGVLEGIAIAKNENGVLFWTPGMGCAVLSNVTGDIKMPSLGSVSYVLSRRCLPEKSFGFACCYELLPETKETKWNDIKIVTDGMTGSVYIEAHCECILLNKSSLFGMKVPHLGTLYRGLDRYKKKLSVGKSYYFRIEFQKENESHVPVIVDLCLEEDDYVQCRVVHVSQESRQYYAVIEPHGQTFERIKKKIDFIVIPFRVLFCAKGVHVETEELLNNCYVVRVRRPNKDHDVVRGLHVESYRQAAKDPMYSVLNKTVWIRALVRTENDSAGPIVLLCPRLEQRVVDFGRLTSKIPKNTSFAVHAQFALTLENEPVFWARYVAPTVHTLPRVTSRMVASLPNIQDIFDSISKDKKTTPSEQSTEKLKSTSNYLQNNMDKTDIQSARGSSSSANFVITESWAASESSTLARSIDSQRCDQSEASDNTILMDQIATESCYASSICSSSSSSTIRDFDKRSALNVDKMRLDDSFEPRRTLFRYNMPGRYQGFGPSSFRRPQTGGRPRRPMRYGLRQLKTVKKHEEILMDTVYSFMNNRMMFVEHERESRESWFRTPTAKVTTAKKTVAFVIPIETTKCRIERIRSYPRFTDLIRFIVLDTTINVCDASVVIPVGGMFPEMPKSFQLGERYKVDHFSFATDRMCRFGGFAKALTQLTFYTEDSLSSMTDKQTMENANEQHFLRFTINVIRPSEPEIKSDSFELWHSIHIPGFIIVEKTPELMNILEPMDLENEESHTYSAVIEPVAGGPMELSILKEKKDDDDHIDVFVFWRLVVEFSEIVPLPKLIEKREKIKEPLYPRKREVGSIQVKDYGMWETLDINTKLAQEKLDLLRSLNDPRVRMIEGPELKPEFQKRKVDVNARRDKMFIALDAFSEQLPMLKSKYYFNYVFEDEFKALYQKLKENDDDFHQYTTKKRSYSLELGMNYLTNLLVNGGVYRSLNEESDFVPMLKVLADCIGLNATYIKKTDDVKNMLHFFRMKKMITYI